MWERGFTLIEVLVVMLIIGVLAAIALPVFLNEERRGHDAAAKTNAGSVVTHVESCFVETEDYGECETNSPGLGDTGLPQGNMPGGVTVQADGRKGYVVAAYSRSGNVFRVERPDPLGPQRRTCTVPAAAADNGGCSDRPTGSW